ncbi:NACHT C-terminal alpha/beta 1 domain-containing protein [Microcoleus sp. BROC3]|uniref:NACHT C-terminal alpha/beta 1 domain-containing protein n=1 Tax=Microcoleus sp. BROC3 TaxID=3055323 RepID=UPI002FCED219
MPSKKKVTYGPAVKERAKRLLEALLAYVNWELEDVAGISLSHTWQEDKTTKQPKLVIETQLRTLEFLTAKDKHEGKLTTTEIRQALNEHLKDFLEILEDNRSKTQGKEDWHFTLKLWSKDKEKNLEQFEIEWERLRPEKSKQQEETLRETVSGKIPKPEDEPINWQEICHQNLAQQKQLTTNTFTNANGMTPQLDEVYVPLAIVERQKPKSLPGNQPEQKETEKLIPIAEQRFFEDVLRQGQSEISQGRKIAIIGEPGSGKTTRLQKIADWILEQDLGLPIWVSLADLTQPTITQYIEDIWLKQTGQSLTIDALTQQKHLIWLLLDGLDEMTSKVEMRHVSALLGGWVQAARVVVTCRVNVWEADKNAFSGFDVFRNLEFNPEQVTDYIRRWFAGMGDAVTGKSLEAALAESENSRLKELIQNPLRLWMLCLIWQTGGGLPETQAGLYAQFVDWVYRWKVDEEILDQREAIDKALARLALAAMEQQDEVSRLRLPESWVLKVLGSRSIFQAVMKLGWLNRVERLPEAICVFYHATFQEYFAALAVDDWDYFLPRNHVNFPVVGKEYQIFEPQWKQVILLWLGRGDVANEEKERFIEALVNFDDGCGEWNFKELDRGFYGYRAYSLAAPGIGELKTCSLANLIVQPRVKSGFPSLDFISDITFLEACKTSLTAEPESEKIFYKSAAWTANSLKENLKNIMFFEFPETVKSEHPYPVILNFIMDRCEAGTPSNSIFYISTHGPNESMSVSILGKIAMTNEQREKLFSALQPHLNAETYENNFNLYQNCYKVLSIVAQNLPYPDFYRAWHGLTQTSPLVQTLNLAQLPQLLQTQLSETNLYQTLQLFCIDGSKFDDRDNPAADIYLQLIKKHHCPKSTEGTPRTLTELKIYWQLLDGDKHPILIFYEDPTSPAAQGLSPTFLNALTRFDGTICLIADTPHPPLQTFSPHDPDLLQTVINWLKRLHLES